MNKPAISFRDKSVLLIGGAPTIENSNKDHDLICWCNMHWEKRPEIPCDVQFLSGEGSLKKAPGCKMAFGRAITSARFLAMSEWAKSENLDFYTIPIETNGLTGAMMQQYGLIRGYTGQIAALHILTYEIKHLHITGMNCYHARQHYKQRTFRQALFWEQIVRNAKGRITVDTTLQALL